MGVLAAPAKRATNPIAENVAISNPNSEANKVPELAPIKNIGVTIPPLPPKPSVMLVKTIFSKKAYQTVFTPCKQDCIVSKPKPRYSFEQIKTNPTITSPPIIPLTGFEILNFPEIILPKCSVSIRSAEQIPKNIPAITTFIKKPSLKTGTKFKGW
jgi:hypothetical protein